MDRDQRSWEATKELLNQRVTRPAWILESLARGLRWGWAEKLREETERELRGYCIIQAKDGRISGDGNREKSICCLMVVMCFCQ